MLERNPDLDPDPPTHRSRRIGRWAWPLGIALAAGLVTWLLGVT